jgi:hypothetical protein
LFQAQPSGAFPPKNDFSLPDTLVFSLIIPCFCHIPFYKKKILYYAVMNPSRRGEMKIKIGRLGRSVFFAVIFFWITAVAFTVQSASDKTTEKDLKGKTTETLQTLKNYSSEQREEAIKKAKQILEDLDAQIDRLEFDFAKKWDQMDQAARKKSTEILKNLRKQRNALAEWYGGLKHSSGKAWEKVKQGFIKSYQDLRDAFKRAEKAI